MLTLNLSLVLILLTQAPQDSTPWATATPDFDWSFPRDHWIHRDYKTEWWYFTGHLGTTADSTSPRFGYQFTFFRIGLVPSLPPNGTEWAADGMIMGHAAVTDNETGRHYFSEVLYRESVVLGEFMAPDDSAVAWSRGPPGTPQQWNLNWNGSGFGFAATDSYQEFGFELQTRAEKPIAFQGPNGYNSKGEQGQASLYYSMTRLATEGIVSLGDSSWSVSGLSWMDKEFGSDQLGREQIGWDWFAIQLFDGRDLMLYRIRGRPQHIHATLIDPGGSATALGSEQWSLVETATWRSDRSDAVYPARWTITIPAEGLRLDVVPTIPDQENLSKLVDNLHYWEGATRVLDAEGKVVGRGFAELTGYGEGSRPAL